MTCVGSCPNGWVDKTKEGLNCYYLHTEKGVNFNYQDSVEVSLIRYYVPWSSAVPILTLSRVRI